MAVTLIVQIDGCDPAYLAAAETPTLDRIAREGFYQTGLGVVPSVTNVNTVSLVTGAFPEVHGVCSNYYIDPHTKEGRYVESAEDVRCPTLFERLPERQSLVMVVKEKLLRLVGRGAHMSLTAEQPPAELVAALGEPADIYSAEINYWLLDACRLLLERNQADLIYLATSDWVFHTFAPEDAEAKEYLENLDSRLERLLETRPDLELYVTADHGMNAKRRALNPALSLRQQGLESTLVPIIKDRYVVHHQNLGGAAYLYLADAGEVTAGRDVLLEIEGVEEVITREEAAARFHLPADRIGDLMILGDIHTVFGELPSAAQEVALRSHGGLHEQQVPIYGYNASVDPAAVEYHLDITKQLANQGEE